MKIIVKFFAVIWARLFEASSWAGLGVLADVLSQNLGQHTAAAHAAIGTAVVSAVIAFLRAEGVRGSVLNDLAILRQAMPALMSLVGMARPTRPTSTVVPAASGEPR